MCLMISNCSGERFVSRMALVKNNVRSTVTDERLSGLSVLELKVNCLTKAYIT